MKSLKNFLQFSFIITIAAFVTVSCNSEATNDSSNVLTIEQSEVVTRTQSKKIKSTTYYYKSLAEFTKGNTTVALTQLAELEDKQVNFVVIYEAQAPWADVFNGGKNLDKTGDDMLNGLMASYEMTITNQFEIDDENEGFVLVPNKILGNAVETARELSMVDHVMMVQIKEVPSDETQPETAANN